MKKGFVSLYNSNDWGLGAPYIWISNTWKTVTPYVYTSGAWKKVCGAGTNMVYLLDSAGNFITDSTNGYILVRQG